MNQLAALHKVCLSLIHSYFTVDCASTPNFYRHAHRMPSELLHFPPAYSFVGLYRLLTDPTIRGPVLDKVKHASIRGSIVAIVYAAVSWRPIDYFIKRFLVGEGWKWFGLKKVREVVEAHEGGRVNVMGMNLDLVFCKSKQTDTVIFSGLVSLLTHGLDTHLLILLPQVSGILRFFVYKNLKIARSRAYALTVSSRRKPPQFWNQVCPNLPHPHAPRLTSRTFSLGAVNGRGHMSLHGTDEDRDTLKNGRTHLNLVGEN